MVLVALAELLVSGILYYKGNEEDIETIHRKLYIVTCRNQL